jgi:hypothetical protein
MLAGWEEEEVGVQPGDALRGRAPVQAYFWWGWMGAEAEWSRLGRGNRRCWVGGWLVRTALGFLLGDDATWVAMWPATSSPAL